MARAAAAGLAAGVIEIALGCWSGFDRAEPGLFLPWRPFVLAGLALVVARSARAGRGAAYAAMLATATLGAAMLAGTAPPSALLVGIALAIVIDMVARAGLAIGGRGLAAAGLALLLAIPGAGRWTAAVAQDDGRPVATGHCVAVLAGVPLRWAEGVSAVDTGVQLAWRVLERAFRLEPADGIAQASAGRLLLVQPRAPGAAGLVAIDAYIRGGARAVILTDPDLRWPSRYPPGDAAAPPRTGTLSPLLRHWGLALARGAPGLTIREVGWAGQRWRLALLAPGRFVQAGDGAAPCRIAAAGLIARCTIGAGSVILLADADLLHPMLWSDPDGGHAPAYRPSDNLAFVAALLAGPDRITPPMRPVLWTECSTTCRSLGIVEP